MAFNADQILPPGAKIKVFGIGGGGSNAVNTMIRANLEGVEFISANTDVQALRFALPERKIQVGKELTKGLGAGADPDVGRDAALEDRHEIQEALAGADMVFITAGMGGGTGTGGASVIAQIAREMGALTVAVVTKPFNFEGKRRRKHSEIGIERLRECVDTLITIPNQRLLEIATPDLTMIDAFRMADAVLVNAVKGISDIINVPGTVNVDFADVKTVMSSMGMALMGIGSATGENRAVEAARKAILSPLLEDVNIEGATGILINITASTNVSLMEVNEACSIIQDAAHEDANIIFGAVIDDTLGDEMRVTVIATGFPAEYEDETVGSASTNKHTKPSNPLFNHTSVSNSNRFNSPSNHKSSGLNRFKNSNFETKNYETKPKAEPAQSSSATPAASTPQALQQQPVQRDIPEFKPFSSTAPEISAVSEAADLTRLTIDGRLPEVGEEVYGATAKDVDLSSARPSSPLSAFDESPTDLDLSEDTTADVRGFTFEKFDDLEPAPMESMFDEPAGAANPNAEKSIFDQKLDEALEIAERIKGAEAKQQSSGADSDDELEVPAFLRGGSKEISLD